MSSYQEYDFENFHFERAQSAGWTSVLAHVNNFQCEESYNPDDNGTLIYQSETASVSMSYWQQPATPVPLYPLDKVRARYGSKVVFLGTVDTTRWTASTDPDADKHGAAKRIDFSANLVGTYAALLSRTVCYLPQSPAPTAINFIRNWITVNNWG